MTRVVGGYLQVRGRCQLSCLRPRCGINSCAGRLPTSKAMRHTNRVQCNIPRSLTHTPLYIRIKLSVKSFPSNSKPVLTLMQCGSEHVGDHVVKSYLPTLLQHFTRASTMPTTVCSSQRFICSYQHLFLSLAQQGLHRLCRPESSPSAWPPEKLRVNC